MSVENYIRDKVLGARLETVLVVYDPSERYRDLCQVLAGENVVLIDAKESGIEGREAASRTFVALGEAGASAKRLLIYVPAERPDCDKARQDDPFSAYAVGGAVFPDGDGDEYLSLCIKARPDQVSEIRELFAQDPSPPFALIDNLGGGLKWPTLRTALRADSSREILSALLAPTPQQVQTLQTGDAWVREAKEFLSATLGLKLITRGKTWVSIADELWRFLLFSEFAFDLPGELPSALLDVPRAPESARLLVEDVCESLRHDPRTRETYIERAEQVETDLELQDRCSEISDLGVRDTFPFEERTVMAGVVAALKDNRSNDVRSILDRHRSSVWTGRGENEAEWGLVEAALRLIEACDDAERDISVHAAGLDLLVDWYVASLREVDRLQREFEQTAADAPGDALVEVIEQGRRRYGRLIGRIAPAFTRHLESMGWPPPGRLANADVFDRFVGAPLKETGRRVAFIMVDALRYELGVALRDELAEAGQVELLPACAQLPTVTPVGMASLLPGAGAGLKLVRDSNGFVPMIGESRLPQVTQRMDLLRDRFGDRFAEMPLSSFLRPKGKPGETIALLVLRSVDIDSQMEANPETSIGLIQATLKQIRRAVHKLKSEGFSDVVIATDHGFFLNHHAEAGDLCAKPPGDWIVVHERSLIGEGAGDGANFAVAAEKVGIRGDFARFAGPRTMAPYRRGLVYFHGGASLQEAIVPVITVRLQQAGQPDVTRASVMLSYRKGAKKITTRLPVVEVAVEGDMFSQESDVEVLIEAHDRSGRVVGEAKPGGPVNPATGTISLKPGGRQQVTVRMDPDFEGRFTLKALNPVTMATYHTLDLETDYAV